MGTDGSSSLKEKYESWLRTNEQQFECSHGNWIGIVNGHVWHFGSHIRLACVVRDGCSSVLAGRILKKESMIRFHFGRTSESVTVLLWLCKYVFEFDEWPSAAFVVVDVAAASVSDVVVVAPVHV
jgi:hypothetical protein